MKNQLPNGDNPLYGWGNVLQVWFMLYNQRLIYSAISPIDMIYNQRVKIKGSILIIIPNDPLTNFCFLGLRLWAILILWS